MLLKTRQFLPTGGFHPAQSLNSGEINHKTVEAASLSFIGHSSEIPLGQPFNIVGVDWPFLPPGSFLFNSGCPIQCSLFHQRHLVVVEDIDLRGANIRIYGW